MLRFVLLFVTTVSMLLLGYLAAGEVVILEYSAPVTDVATSTSLPVRNTDTPPVFSVTHIAPPEVVRAAYMTSCIASGKRLRAPLLELINKTELNAVVIDIKDYTGTISFETEDPDFVLNRKGCHVPDMKEFIGELHEKGIYVIGRVTVMQDVEYPKRHPDSAVKKKDGSIWRDKKGLTFIDPGARDYWKHMVDLGKISYDVGFDEINYDYIRFPSDGDMTNIMFTHTGSTSKQEMMRQFYAYLGAEMGRHKIPISADIFGMTTTNTDDLNIGQILEHALLHFDYVAPMVYPSHYPPNFNGWKDPNHVPYEIIRFAMGRAVERAHKMEELEAGFVSSTATPKFIPTGKYAKKLRPWIQDFDYGKEYTATDVRAQIRATYDVGIMSWMTWDPSNKYTPSAYETE